MDWMAERIGQLVDLIGFEADRPVQMFDHTGRWVGLAKCKIYQLPQKDNLVGHQVELVACKVVLGYQKVAQNR